MVSRTSTSGGSICPYPFKFIFLRVSKIDSIAFLFMDAISSAIAAEKVLAILASSNKLIHDKDIKGNMQQIIKIGLLPDDLTLVLKDLLSVENVLKLSTKFSLCSGLRINIDKRKQN